MLDVCDFGVLGFRSVVSYQVISRPSSPVDEQHITIPKGVDMKLRGFCSILLLCLLVFSSGTSTIAFQQSQDVLTEDKVVAMLNSVDAAARRGNLAGLVSPLARDIKMKVTVTIPKSAQEQTVTLTKEQYTLLTRRALRRRRAYQLQRKNTQVKIYGDNKTAMVTSDLYETLTLPEGTLRTVSSEVSIVTLQGGRVVINSQEARVRFY